MALLHDFKSGSRLRVSVCMHEKNESLDAATWPGDCFEQTRLSNKSITHLCFFKKPFSDYPNFLQFTSCIVIPKKAEGSKFRLESRFNIELSLEHF